MDIKQHWKSMTRLAPKFLQTRLLNADLSQKKYRSAFPFCNSRWVLSSMKNECFKRIAAMTQRFPASILKHGCQTEVRAILFELLLCTTWQRPPMTGEGLVREGVSSIRGCQASRHWELFLALSRWRQDFGNRDWCFLLRVGISVLPIWGGQRNRADSFHGMQVLYGSTKVVHL